MSETTRYSPPSDEENLDLTASKNWATGLPAVRKSLEHVYSAAGVKRGTEALLKLNQKGGFDCPSCAWPDPDNHRAIAEFCENGAKATASETTRKTITASFFAEHSVSDLLKKSDAWMEQQGRLAEPVVRRAGSDHYESISWADAFKLVANELKSLSSPDEAIFYTSGRTGNESAFLYQLMIRQFGTNNLPDCSNMCHESSGAALSQAIGVGKGTVTLADFYEADAIICVGQNPGTNHPRMLSALEIAVKNGAEVIAINPLKEAGLQAFANPQKPLGLVNRSQKLASQYLQIHPGGDHALFRAIGKLLLEWSKSDQGILDREFIDQHTADFDAYVESTKSSEWPDLLKSCKLPRAEIETLARSLLKGKRRLITCWAMGITQHRHAVATIREITNIHLLLGAIGRPGAGVCPVRGHSNVQGDRTMGIWEKMSDDFHDALDETFNFKSPRHHGYDTVESIDAMNSGKASVFFAMGGNFLQASPDTAVTGAALEKCSLNCHVATKLNRSHLVRSKVSLILPCLGRSDHDIGENGDQFITCENSMGVVQSSQGSLEPVSTSLRSEPAIVAGVAAELIGDTDTIRWKWLAADYDRIRDLIEAAIPGFENFNERVRKPGGFYLPNPAKDRVWQTLSKKANFSSTQVMSADLPKGRFLLQTMRSHDQYNTTVYGLDDRYRGIGHSRRIVFLNPDDMKELGINPTQEVDLTSYWEESTRTSKRFQAIPYDMPRQAAAAYFPEANDLVPLHQTALESNTPCSKGIVITVQLSE